MAITNVNRIFYGFNKLKYEHINKEAIFKASKKKKTNNKKLQIKRLKWAATIMWACLAMFYSHNWLNPEERWGEEGGQLYLLMCMQIWYQHHHLQARCLSRPRASLLQYWASHFETLPKIKGQAEGKMSVTSDWLVEEMLEEGKYESVFTSITSDS